MILLNNVPVDIVNPGDYTLNVAMTTGSITFEISMDGEPFNDISDAAFNQNTTAVIELPQSQIRVQITGDGVAQLKLQNRSR